MNSSPGASIQEEAAISEILTNDRDYFELLNRTVSSSSSLHHHMKKTGSLVSIQNNLPIHENASSRPRTLATTEPGLLPDLLTPDTSACIGPAIGGTAFNLLSPSMMLPLEFGQPLLQDRRSPNRCSCLTTQLHCIAELSEDLEYDRVQLDSVLETARKISQAINQYITCHACHKTSFGCILITIALQRLILRHCNVARNSPVYIRQTRVSIGLFQLSEEEDRIHKQMIIIYSAKRMGIVVAELEKAVQDCRQRQQNSELATLTGQSNLGWVLETLQILKRRVAAIITLTQRDDWGFRDFPYDESH